MEEESDEEIELESTRIISGQPQLQPQQQPAPLTTTTTTTTDTETSSTATEPTGAAALAARRAAEVAARLMAAAGVNKPQPVEVETNDDSRPVYAEEIVINDFPQKARWKVTNKVNNIYKKRINIINCIKLIHLI